MSAMKHVILTATQTFRVELRTLYSYQDFIIEVTHKLFVCFSFSLGIQLVFLVVDMPDAVRFAGQLRQRLRMLSPHKRE